MTTKMSRQLKWYHDNKDVASKTNRRWRESNKSRVSENNRAYREAFKKKYGMPPSRYYSLKRAGKIKDK